MFASVKFELLNLNTHLEENELLMRVLSAACIKITNIFTSLWYKFIRIMKSNHVEYQSWGRSDCILWIVV